MSTGPIRERDGAAADAAGSGAEPATLRPPTRDALREIDLAAGLAADAELSRRIVFADDEPTIRAALGRFLQGRGFDVTIVADGATALAEVQRGGVACLLTDARMPGMSGHDLVRQAHAADPHLAIVMLTALTDAQSATEALTAGAVDYLTKPVELLELQQALERALARRQRSVRESHLARLVRDAVLERTAELEAEQAALRALTLATAEALVNAMEAKDPYLRGHSRRVGHYAATIGRVLGATDEECARLLTAGRLHDIGKIGIRETVLHKRGPLTPEEYRHVQDHVRIGVEILSPIAPLQRVVPYIADHHEHWDGSGYPAGRAGAAISEGGRILAAADRFDALTSARPYRGPMAWADALAYLATQRGRLLAPDVVDALQQVARDEPARLAAHGTLDDGSEVV